MSSNDSALKQRTTASVGDYCRTRIPVDLWREMGEPEKLTVDLVGTADGSLEVRLRRVEE